MCYYFMGGLDIEKKVDSAHFQDFNPYFIIFIATLLI